MEELPQGDLGKRLDEENAIRTASTSPTQGRDEENVIYVRLKLPRVRWLLLGLAIVGLVTAALLPSTPGFAQETVVKWGRNSYVLIRGHSDMASPLAKIVELGNEVKSKEATIAAQNEERERLLSQLHATEDIVNKLGSQLRATEDVVNERNAALGSTQASLRSTQSQLGTTQSRLSETQTQLERNARLIQAYDDLKMSTDQMISTGLNMINTGTNMWNAAIAGQWALGESWRLEYERLRSEYTRLVGIANMKLQALRSLF